MRKILSILNEYSTAKLYARLKIKMSPFIGQNLLMTTISTSTESVPESLVAVTLYKPLSTLFPLVSIKVVL